MKAYCTKWKINQTNECIEDEYALEYIQNM